MGRIEFDEGNGVFFEWTPSVRKDAPSFVFFNALTGDHTTWEGYIAPECRGAGFGTLVFNYRGQRESPFSAGIRLNDDLIVSDGLRLLKEIQPSRAVLVGLSIGGLFAARVALKGFKAAGVVLINTLRRDGPRLKWIGDALVRVARVGGLELLRDLYLPLLMGEEWLLANRESFLNENGYEGLDVNSGPYKLLSEAGRETEWAFPWEALNLPVLVVTGLQDHVFYDERDVSEQTARLRNGKRVDIPDAGHLIPAEKPEALTEMLLRFAREV